MIETIRQDLTKAMKARDELRLRTLRAVIAAVQEAQVSGSEARQLSDDDVLKIISSQVKRRVEAAAAFSDGARPEMAEAELAEKTVLEEYLPAALSSQDLEAIVDATLSEGGWTTKADMGQAMKAINAKVAGRADGKTIAQLVKSRLS